MHFFTAYCWDGGSKTAKNQDSLALCQMVVRRKRCLMAVVCDGIGSLADSERISGFVTEQLVTWFFGNGANVMGKSIYKGMMKNIVKRELYRIRGEICNVCEAQCGCTLSMLLICEHNFWIWNVGDSRVYRGHGKNDTVLTKDDTYRGMLTKCLGNFKWQGIYFKKGHVGKKDTFIICTDGFYRMLSQNEMHMILSKKVYSEKQAEKLLNEAVLRLKAKGEKDDISAIYVGAAEYFA